MNLYISFSIPLNLFAIVIWDNALCRSIWLLGSYSSWNGRLIMQYNLITNYNNNTPNEMIFSVVYLD